MRFCPATDQIGTPRPQGGGCDIGAIESTTAIPAPTPVATLCTLQDQIIAANTDRAFKACPAGKGADTIHMVRDYSLSATLPAITSEITIFGNGHQISGSGQYGIFDVDGGTLTIEGVTLTEGQASRGGAIRLRNDAHVTASNVTFSDNSAILGGAISTESENDTLTVTNSSFVSNRAENIGGAIVADGGSTDVSGSAFQNNQVTEKGGAIAAVRGNLAMSNSTLHGNEAEKGGGVYINGAVATLTHLTLMSNVAGRIIGAGIYAESGKLNLRNSIVAGSGNGDDCSGRLDQNRGNFSQDGSCSAQAGGDPLLAELVGSPAHHPLMDTSPAHGTADPTFCLSTDQLGRARPACDIGAIESERSSNVEAVPEKGLPSDCSLRDQIVAANTDEPAGSCPAGDGADMIVITRDVTLSEALPAITDDITISGKGHTISGNKRLTIFDIENGAAIIKNMTLIDGRNPEGEGGAITLRNSAKLTVVNVTFRDNKARFGGAISSLDSSRLEVFDSIFVGNAAEQSGGAIWNDGVCGNIDNNQFRRSSAGSDSRSQAGTGLKTEIHLDGPANQCASDMMNYFSDA